MKKILVLTSLFVMIFCDIGFSQISVDPFTDSSDVTVDHLEDQRATFQDAINSADGRLIQSGTLSADSLDDNANPVVRWDEAFTDFVFTGLLPTTSATLTTATSSGTAYVEGVRVVKVETNKTYSLSRDTYVDVSSNGTYTYSEVSLGGSTPSVAISSIRLAKVTTDTTTVSAVDDLRILSITLSISQIKDSDGDTVIDVEQVADEDIIRFSVGVADVKTEQIFLEDGLLSASTDNDLGLGSQEKKFKDIYVEGPSVFGAISADTAILSSDSAITTLDITQSIALDAGEHGISLVTNAVQVNDELLLVKSDNPLATADMVNFDCDNGLLGKALLINYDGTESLQENANGGTGNNLFLSQTGTQAGGKYALNVQALGDQDNAELAFFNQNNASSAGGVMTLFNAGTGNSLFIDSNSNSLALLIDSEVNNDSNIIQVDPAGSSPLSWGIQRNDDVNGNIVMFLGGNFIWVDSTGDLRINAGNPTSDTDGVVVGTQS